MKNVNYIIGNENIITKPLKAFDDEVCNFLNDLSSAILKSAAVREFPDLASVGYWLRKANIQKLKENYTEKRLGKGLCFHITPSNIPVNSFFSYFFALLAGNANVVRFPSKDFPQLNALVEIFKSVVKNYPEIEKRTAFVKYDKTSTGSEDFSKIADCRMIWGGDRTISSIRTLESKPRCVDITFADRYSVCIIDGKAVLESDEKTLQRLSENFYNDTYLMDQNACSSPQLMLWENDSKEARERFWEVVYKTAEAKYNLQDAVCVDKYTKLCEDAIDCEILENADRRTNLLYRVDLKNIAKDVTEIRAKGGYFYEYSLKNRKELFDIVNEKYQTVTYFGIDPLKLRDEIVENNLSGIDRVVPIGQAMDIGAVWDGHDIIRELSREVFVNA